MFMFTLQQILDATEEGLRELYEKKPAERDQELSKRVLALARLAYNINGSKGRTAYHLALALGARGRNKETIVYFEEAIAKDLYNADYCADYASTLLSLKRPDEKQGYLHVAEIYIVKAKELDPRNGQFDCVKGEIDEAKGQYEDALRCYRRGKARLEVYPNPRPEHVRSLRIAQECIERVTHRLDEMQQKAEAEISEKYVPPWLREHWGGIMI